MIAGARSGENVNALPCGDDEFAGRNSVDVEHAVVHANDSFFVVPARIFVGLLVHMHAVRQIAENELRGVEAIAPNAVYAENRGQVPERSRFHQHIVHDVFVPHDFIVVTRCQHIHDRKFVAHRQSFRQQQLHRDNGRAEMRCIYKLAHWILLLDYIAPLEGIHFISIKEYYEEERNGITDNSAIAVDHRIARR